MLVDLTPNIKEIERRKKVYQENNIDERHLCSHENNHIETSVYRCGCQIPTAKARGLALKNNVL